LKSKVFFVCEASYDRSK